MRTPDARARARAVVVGCAAMAQHGVVLLLLGPVLPDLMSEFSVREGLAGVLLSVGSLGFTMGPLVAGRLIERRGVRAAVLVGASVELAALTAFGVVPAFAAAVALSFLLRFGASFVENAVNVLPVTLREAGRSDEGRNASLMNLMHSFFGLGALVTPVGVGLIVQLAGKWRGAFYGGAAVTALLLAAAWLGLPRGVALPPAGAPARAVPAGRAGALRDPFVLAGAFVLFLYVGAEVGISSWIVLYLRKRFELAPVAAGTALTLMWVGMTVGRSVNSLLARRVSVRNLVLWAAALGVASGAGLAAAGAPAAAFVFLLLFGLAISGIFPNVMSSVNSRFPDRVGRVTAVLTIAAAAGAMTLHPVVGGLAQAFGIAAVVIVPCVLLAVLAVVYAVVTRASRGGEGTRSAAPDAG